MNHLKMVFELRKQQLQCIIMKQHKRLLKEVIIVDEKFTETISPIPDGSSVRTQTSNSSSTKTGHQRLLPPSVTAYPYPCKGNRWIAPTPLPLGWIVESDRRSGVVPST
jgi:hypothetical protein